MKKKRKKISKVVRQQIAEKQQNTCGECKQLLSIHFQLDHVIALQFGGTDEESNLMALCCECHNIKSISLPLSVVNTFQLEQYDGCFTENYDGIIDRMNMVNQAELFGTFLDITKENRTYILWTALCT